MLINWYCGYILLEVNHSNQANLTLDVVYSSHETMFFNA